MFILYEHSDLVANAFRYRGVSFRFTYLIDIKTS